MRNITKIFGFFKNELKLLLRSKKFRRTFIVVVLLILILTGGLFYLKREGRVFIDDSLVQAPIINITSQTAGNLNEIDVADGQSVKNGDLLAVVGTQALRAQVDGIIIQSSKQIGSLISPQITVVQMINPDDFRIVGILDENKGLKDLRVGQVASFTVDAFPGQTFWGYVDEVSPTAKQTQIAFSISSERPTQQFNIFVRYDSYKYPQLKNGMSARLIIYTNTN